MRGATATTRPIPRIGADGVIFKFFAEEMADERSNAQSSV